MIRSSCKRGSSPLRASCPVSLLALLVGVSLPLTAGTGRAGSYDWTGGGSNNNWNNSRNWAFGAPVSDIDQTDVFFAGHPDYPLPYLELPYNVHSLNISSDANGYFFSGQSLTFGVGGITQNSPNEQVFGNPVNDGAVDTTLTLGAGAGPLTFSGGFEFRAPGDVDNSLTINASSTTGAGNVINGNLGTGTGGNPLNQTAVYKTGPGILTLTGNNVFRTLTVQTGTLAFARANALGDTTYGSVIVNEGAELRATANAGTLMDILLNGTISADPGKTVEYQKLRSTGTMTFGSATETGTVNVFALSGTPLVVVAGGTLAARSSALATLLYGSPQTTVAAGATLDFRGYDAGVRNLLGAGTVILGAGTVIGGTPSTNPLVLQGGNFSGTLVLGTSGLVKSTVDTLTLSGASSYSGLTALSAGTLAFAGNANYTVNNLTVTGTPASPATLGVADSALLAAGGTVNISGTGAGASVAVQTGGTFTLTGTAASGNVLYLGNNAGESAAYTLQGGSLNAPATFVGYSGAGTFTQSGGTHTVTGTDAGSNQLYLGFGATGSGAYTLQGGSLNASSIDVGDFGAGTLTLNGGTARVASTVDVASFSGSTGTVNLNSGSLLQAGGILGGSGQGALNLNGGTLRAAGGSTTFLQGLSSATVQAGGFQIDTNGFNVTVAQSLAHDASLGAGVPDGGLTKFGAGTLNLTGTNTYTGDTVVRAGTLAADSDRALGASVSAVDLFNGASLTFTGTTTVQRTFNMGIGTLSPASGGSITYQNATVNGGTLGAGSHILNSNAALNGVRTTSGTALSTGTGGTILFNNVTLSGTGTLAEGSNTTINSTGDLTANAQTTTTLDGTLNVAGGYLSGALTINNGGRVNEGGTTPLYLDGSRGTTINAGGRLGASGGSTLELGGLLVNNGQQAGVLNVNLGGVTRGTGSYGTVNVNTGATFGVNAPATGNGAGFTMGFYRPSESDGLASALFVGPLLASVPGSANVVSLTLGSGSVFAFRVQDAQGTAGSGYDSVGVGGVLALSAGTAAGSQITINVGSLAVDGTPGQAGNFDPTKNYTFVLVAAGGGITGFDPGEFIVDASGFRNGTNGGGFSVVQQGTNLALVFTGVVPEPGAWTLLCMGAGGLWFVARRRSRQEAARAFPG